LLRDGVAWSLGLSVTVVGPAKMAEAIEMLFGLRTQVGPRDHVLDGRRDPPWEGNLEEGRGGTPVVVCTKTAELIEVPFWLGTWVGPRNHVLDGGPDKSSLYTKQTVGHEWIRPAVDLPGWSRCFKFPAVI